MYINPKYRMILTPSRQAEDAGNLDIAMKNKYPYIEMAGWGATGVFIRAMALPMQLKPMFYSKILKANDSNLIF